MLVNGRLFAGCKLTASRQILSHVYAGQQEFRQVEHSHSREKSDEGLHLCQNGRYQPVGTAPLRSTEQQATDSYEWFRSLSFFWFQRKVNEVKQKLLQRLRISCRCSCGAATYFCGPDTYRQSLALL